MTQAARTSRQRYGNRQGDSGVTHYDARGRGEMKVWFAGGEGYLYTEAIPGAAEVAAMKALAAAGRGLSSFISQHVRERYAARLP